MYLCVKGIAFASFYDFDIGLWNYSHSVFVLHFIVQVPIHKASSGNKDSYFLYWKLAYNQLIYYMNKPNSSWIPDTNIWNEDQKSYYSRKDTSSLEKLLQ